MPRKFEKGDDAIIIQSGEPVKIHSCYFSGGDIFYRIQKLVGPKALIYTFAEKELITIEEYAPQEKMPEKPKSLPPQKKNLFICQGCSDGCELRTKVSTTINNADISICPKGMVPKFVLVEPKDLEPMKRRLPVCVCEICPSVKYFCDVESFLRHIIEAHSGLDSSLPYTRLVYSSIKHSRQ